MSDTAENVRSRIGGNSPPPQDQFKEINEALPGYLESTYETTFKRAADLIAAFERMPESITTEELAGRAADFAAQIASCVKEAEAYRTDLISGPLAAQRLINTTFDKKVFADLDPDNKRAPGIKQKVLSMLTVWERKKADMERARRAEEERKAREASEAAERARQEAERKAREAAEAERARQEAEARRVREAEEAERRRVADELRKAREAAEVAAKAIRDEQDLEKAIALEAAERDSREKREAEAKIAREKAENEAISRAAKAAYEAAVARSKFEAEQKEAREKAERAAADAAEAKKSADAKASELHQVRGDYGASSSLRTTWKGYITDREKLDLEALRPFLSDETLEKALNAYVKINKGSRQIAGADIKQVTGAAVRG